MPSNSIPFEGMSIEFESPPPVMCSSGLTHYQDFKGIQLQNPYALRSIADLLFVTSFHGGDRGIVAFSWLAGNDRTCRAFIESLEAISDEFVTAALLTLFFTHCENIHMAPDWWEVLPQQTRNALLERFRSSTNLEEAIPKAELAIDGISVAPWAVAERYEIPAKEAHAM